VAGSALIEYETQFGTPRPLSLQLGFELAEFLLFLPENIGKAGLLGWGDDVDSALLRLQLQSEVVGRYCYVLSFFSSSDHAADQGVVR
jgi:hypothetical protein